jgi:surfactin synthase thioesterase subunit
LLPYLDRPFAFFGHCSGALPGYQTTLRLMQAGLPLPSVLFVSSQVAPQDGPNSRFLTMTDAELQLELASLVRALGGIPDPDLLELGVMILRADVEATRRYLVSEPTVLPCRLTVIGWQEDRDVPVAQLAGWSECAPAERLRQVVLPGSHYSFLSAPRVLLDELAADMAVATGSALSRSTPGGSAA